MRVHISKYSLDRYILKGDNLMKFQGAHSVDYPVLMAGLTIAAIPIILIYLTMQKHIKGFSYRVTGG